MQKMETHCGLNYPMMAKLEWEAKGQAFQKGRHPSHEQFWGEEEEHRHHQPRL